MTLKEIGKLQQGQVIKDKADNEFILLATYVSYITISYLVMSNDTTRKLITFRELKYWKYTSQVESIDVVLLKLKMLNQNLRNLQFTNPFVKIEKGYCYELLLSSFIQRLNLYLENEIVMYDSEQLVHLIFYDSSILLSFEKEEIRIDINNPKNEYEKALVQIKEDNYI